MTIAIGLTIEPVAPMNLSGVQTKVEIQASRVRECFQVEILDDVDAVLDQEGGVAGELHIELGIPEADGVPGHGVGAGGLDAETGEPFRGAAVHAGTGEIAIGVVPDQIVAGADQHDIAGLDLDALRGRNRLQLLRADHIAGDQRGDAAMPGDIEQDAAGHDRADVLDAVFGIPAELDRLLRRHAAVEREIDRLVAERVDMRAGMLHRHDDAGRSRTRAFGSVANRVAMPAMEGIEVARAGANRGPASP